MYDLLSSDYLIQRTFSIDSTVEAIIYTSFADSFGFESIVRFRRFANPFEIGNPDT